MPRGAEADEEVNGGGVDDGDGEEVREENQGVGDYVRGKTVDAGGGFTEENGAFIEENGESFGCGREEEC